MDADRHHTHVMSENISQRAGIRPHLGDTRPIRPLRRPERPRATNESEEEEVTVKTIMLGTALGTAASLALAAAGLGQDVTPPAGAYTLDKNHATITWAVNHLGTSTYVARFNEFDANLTFNPDDPASSTLTATIDVTSLDLDYSDPAEPDLFYNELLGRPTSRNAEGDDRFFRADEFPTITFASTAVEVTGEAAGKITGDLTFMGQTHPLTLDVTFNGARADLAGGPPVIGFSATTTVKRSQWGMDALVPYVGDDVQVRIEAEFIAPAA
jgi:polyisoprenoid-binding protein YceI